MMEATPPETTVPSEATTGDPSHVAAFNEWMRRYTEAPEQFRREWQSVREYLKDENEGKEPAYGQTCAVFFAKLLAEKDNR